MLPWKNLEGEYVTFFPLLLDVIYSSECLACSLMYTAIENWEWYNRTEYWPTSFQDRHHTKKETSCIKLKKKKKKKSPS
jgi:hypothetical protein